MRVESTCANLSNSVLFKRLLALLLLATISPRLRAAEHWIRLTTPHFEMYTTNGERQGTAALKVFEQVRYFFLQNSRSKSAPDAHVRIIAFRSEKEYKPYRLNEGAFAYYLRTRKVDYIVMQDLSPEHYQSAMHEYTHLVVEHLGLNLPVWFNEGLADLYSSLEPRGNQAIVGRPLEGRANILLTQRWLDLNLLFAVTPESPYYNERDKMSIFYAQSWALTHMIALGKTYRPEFPRFLAAVAAGRPAADSFQSVYGKSLVQVTQDLHAYLHQSSVQAALFDVKLSKPDLEPEVVEPPQFNVDLALADLLASQKQTSAAAADRLSRLARDHPESPDVQESLGYLEWQQGEVGKARESFRLATDRGSKDPEMLFHYSQLLRESGAPADQILAVLQHAVTIRPGYPDALFDLGMTAMNTGQWGVALIALSQIKTVTPDRAYAFFSALAYCDLQLKNRNQARSMAEKAKQYAKSPDQVLQTSNMLRHLDALDQNTDVQSDPDLASSTAPHSPMLSADKPSAPGSGNHDLPRDVPSIHWPGNLQHVEAVAKSFECNPKAPRLHVIVNSKEMVFGLDDPKEIVVRNGKSGSFEMHCGPQEPFKIGIFYIPSNPPASVDDRMQGRLDGWVDGMIRELVF